MFLTYPFCIDIFIRSPSIFLNYFLSLPGISLGGIKEEKKKASHLKRQQPEKDNDVLNLDFTEYFREEEEERV